MPRILQFGTEKTLVEIDDVIPLQSSLGNGSVSQHATVDSIHEAVHLRKIGWWNYHPSDYQIPRVYGSGDGWVKIVNDGAGAGAQYAYRPETVTDIFNVTTGQLDFTELSLGDTFEFRIDLDITTSVANQEVLVRGEFGLGGTPYTVSMASLEKKTSGTYQLSTYRGGPVASENTRLNPAEFQIFSTNNFTYTLQMLYFNITRR